MVYHEAAAVDGAGAWQQFRRITLPLLAPVTLFVVVITTISAYNVFTQVYVLASDVQGSPGRLVRVLVYDIFENGFRFFKMGYAAAEAMYLFVIILALTVIQFRFLQGERPMSTRRRDARAPTWPTGWSSRSCSSAGSSWSSRCSGWSARRCGPRRS